MSQTARWAHYQRTSVAGQMGNPWSGLITALQSRRYRSLPKQLPRNLLLLIVNFVAWLHHKHDNVKSREF